jgi:hypothetical protein
MLRDAADRLLPKVLPRAPDKARPPSGAFSVTKVESIGQVDVIANHAHGMTVTRSGKSGIAHVRHSHDGLVRVLDLCSDVPEFKTFPFAIHWEEGKRKGVFQPDFSVSDPTGETVVIHVAYDDDEAKFALAVAKGTSLKMKVVRADIMDDPMTKLVLNMLATAKLAWNGRDAGVATTLGVARGTKSIPISQAVKLLTIAGYGRAEHGFAFGTTEERATSCLAAAIANGSVGFDFGRSQVGDPKLTGETCLFWPLVSRHQIR